MSNYFEEQTVVENEVISPESEAPATGEKRALRTKQRAKSNGPIVDIHPDLAIPTVDKYWAALLPIAEEETCIFPVPLSDEGAQRLLQGSLKMPQYNPFRSEVLDKNVCFDLSDNVEPINVPMLYMIYSIMLRDTEVQVTPIENLPFYGQAPKFLDRKIKVYVPELVKAIYGTATTNRMQVDMLLSSIAPLQKYLGIMRYEYEAKARPQFYWVLKEVEYNEEDNTLSFVSPYLCRLAIQMLLLSKTGQNTKETKKNQKQQKQNPKQKREPTHSFDVCCKIINAPNRGAIELTLALAALFARAGHFHPHINAQKLVNRCPYLKWHYDHSWPNNKNVLLARAFKGAYKLLETQTNYAVPEDNRIIPKAKQLESLTLTFIPQKRHG